MALPDLTGERVNDTYQRLLQVGTNNTITDGTGSTFIPSTAKTASFVNTLNQPVIISGSLHTTGSLTAFDNDLLLGRITSTPQQPDRTLTIHSYNDSAIMFQNHGSFSKTKLSPSSFLVHVVPSLSVNCSVLTESSSLPSSDCLLIKLLIAS